MPTLLSDPPQMVYLVLGGLIVITGLIAAQRQNRRAVLPFVAAFLLMFAVFLIDRLVESPREEAVRRSYMLQMAADARNREAFGEHLADKVTIEAGNGEKTFTRDELKQHAFWHVLQTFNAQVVVKDFSREDAIEINENNVEIGFVGRVDPQGQQWPPVYVRATYSKQSDGSFKLTGLKVYEAVERNKKATIPGFP
jgi:hypothetical protein